MARTDFSPVSHQPLHLERMLVAVTAQLLVMGQRPVVGQRSCLGR